MVFDAGIGLDAVEIDHVVSPAHRAGQRDALQKFHIQQFAGERTGRRIDLAAQYGGVVPAAQTDAAVQRRFWAANASPWDRAVRISCSRNRRSSWVR